MTQEDVLESLAEECHADHVGLWEIVDAVRCDFGAADAVQTRALTLRLVQRLLSERGMQENPWQRLLRDARSVLALPPDEQIRINGPGCVACDLLNDFDHARIVALGSAPELSQGQWVLLERIDAVMRGMQQPDFECFNNKAVLRPVWQELRELAAEGLRAFRWERVAVRPFVEDQPGVWHRPLAEAEPAEGGA